MDRLGTPLVVLAALLTLTSACSSTGSTQADKPANVHNQTSVSSTVFDQVGLPDQNGQETADETPAKAPHEADQPDSLRFDADAPEPVIFDDPSSWPRSIGVARAPTADGALPDYQDLFLPDRSYVATVTTDGVASLAHPAEGPAQHWFSNPTQFGGDRVFLVTDQTSSPEFIKISLPIKPNGQEGWIRRDHVVISEVEHRAVVDLTNHALTVWRADEILVQTKVVTGKPSTPTPVGRFFIRDIIAKSNPGGAYGPYILALSGFSETLESFAGGLPAIAIHGTNNPGLVGQERSNGCIRIPNDLVSQLARSVPLGTPVTVVA